MKLTQPVSIGNLTLKNRMVMAPMGVDLGNYDERTRLITWPGQKAVSA